jgi:hypothetical protein
LSTPPHPVVIRYFELDAAHDVESKVALFAEDATVVDEGRTHHGLAEIRAWQVGPASTYAYTTEIKDTEILGPGHYVVDVRLTGNFPGGTADLRFDFAITDERIARLAIAP